MNAFIKIKEYEKEDYAYLKMREDIQVIVGTQNGIDIGNHVFAIVSHGTSTDNLVMSTLLKTTLRERDVPLIQTLLFERLKYEAKHKQVVDFIRLFSSVLDELENNHGYCKKPEVKSLTDRKEKQN